MSNRSFVPNSEDFNWELGTGNAFKMKTAKEIAELVQTACIQEVCAPKPGNINRGNDFSDTSLEDFLLSAAAIAPAFEDAERSPVGQIVWRAVADARRRVRSNTNLGMILLLAPLAKACLAASGINELRRTLNTVLESLSVEDAKLTYAAIRLANPGGLGRVPEADVQQEPSITLLEAMALAKEWDSIAREYASNFEITFEIGWPAMKDTLSKGADFPDAIVQAYLVILSRVPDTLIARKTDFETARRISLQAEQVLSKGGTFTSGGREALAEFDRGLRDPGHMLNPGATADLSAAAIFLTLIEGEYSLGREPY